MISRSSDVNCDADCDCDATRYHRGTIMMYLQPFVTVQVEPNEPTLVQKQTQFAQVTRRLLSI